MNRKASFSGVVLAVLVSSLLGGCCTFKDWFGMHSYSVQVRRGDDELKGMTASVLVVWPATAAVKSEFEKTETLIEAVELATKLENEGSASGRFAYLGNFDLGDDDCRVAVDRDGNTLRRHCSATEVLVFTNMAEEPEVISILNATPKYAGYLLIDLTQEGQVDVRIVSSISASAPDCDS